MSVEKLATPGVYVREIPSLPPSVAEVETAIPAFIGYTEKAQEAVAGDLIQVAKKISGLSDYEVYFGGPPSESADSIHTEALKLESGQYDVSIKLQPDKLSQFIMYNAIRHFYDNGGGVCYIVSVGNYNLDGGGANTVDSESLKKGLDIIKNVDEVTLLVVPESTRVTDKNQYTAVCQKMIAQAAELMDRMALIDPFQVTPKSKDNPTGKLDEDMKIIREATSTPSKNSFAAAYYPNLLTSYSLNYSIEGLKVSVTEGSATTEKEIKATDKGSVLYNKLQAELKKLYLELPPSGAIAGLYASVDSTKGVWKAPANESLSAVIKPTVLISDAEQGSMNIDPESGKSVNAIRSFPGFGTLVWGARTLNGNDNEWKYISVRRFFNMVEESVKKSSQWAVFESNDTGTWIKIKAMIENYLLQKWRDGALAGTKPDQAYYVRVGLGSTMNAIDILEGRMNIEIGMAVVRPAEFIILKFTQLMQQS